MVLGTAQPMDLWLKKWSLQAGAHTGEAREGAAAQCLLTVASWASPASKLPVNCTTQLASWHTSFFFSKVGHGGKYQEESSQEDSQN